MLIAARNAMLITQRDNLPYDAEVEYLESTGTQYIDTGVVPSARAISAEIGCRVKSVPMVSHTYGVFGSNSQDGSNNIQFGVYQSKWRVKLSSIGIFGTDFDSNYHVIRLNTVTGTFLDGTRLLDAQLTIPSSNTLPISLFGINYSGRTIDGPGNNHGLTGEIYYCKIYDNGVLVRDFIPVRFTNELGQSEGAMYDRANPTVGMNPDGSARTDGLYRNRGTGVFLYGNDVPKRSLMGGSL